MSNIDDEPLSPELRALLERERAPAALSPEHVARIHDAVRARILPPVGDGGDGGPSAHDRGPPNSEAGVPEAPASVGRVARRWLERAALLAIGGLVGAGIHAAAASHPAFQSVMRSRHDRTSSEGQWSAPVESTFRPSTPPTPAAVAPPLPASAQADEHDGPAATVAALSTSRLPMARTPVADDLHERDRSLAQERVLIESASSAFARRRYDDALEATAEHAQRFVRGQLVEERESIRIRALAASGQTEEAWARAEVFRSRFPASMFRALVDQAVRDPRAVR